MIALGVEGAPGLGAAAVTLRGERAGAPADERVLGRIGLERLSATGQSSVQFVVSRSAVLTADGAELAGVSWRGGRLLPP